MIELLFIVKVFIAFTPLWSIVSFGYAIYLLFKREYSKNQVIENIDIYSFVLWGILCLTLRIYCVLDSVVLSLNQNVPLDLINFIVIYGHIIVMILIYIHRIYHKMSI